ncbi:DNA-binding transcriptional regulator, HxlR family [Parapedobacter composti]|uniref:DNA-binding transcriptional regulator, HxlR family n=1 Tax=Parapedobacter composti TaxID=623281 RepID=A0A1I1GJ49_9SPHI|nr:helix-turn-helix domain-containing protein [Parapedobacter composti]SFC11466.1 DNA-binding transcriptional regulator, HxlR family [Parapedobacter composti]
MYVNKIPQALDYGVSVTMKVIGGKWKPCIIDCIANGINRPADIRKAIKHASLRVINHQLTELLAYEVVSKQTYQGYPLRVEYKLTTFGKTLLSVIEAMQKWGDAHAEKVAEIAMKRNENIGAAPSRP